MQLNLPGKPHLTYCTNIHAGESWDEVAASLRTHTLKVKHGISPEARMGVGLRLSGEAAARLARGDAIDRLVEFLDEAGLYVFTVNAFPYGPFHGVRVKEGVYEPDWREPERLRFTDEVAGILARLLPRGMEGSVSTVPGAFRTNVTSRADLEAISSALLHHAAHLCMLERATGKCIALALEPEPACLLETTDEAIAFFQEHLLNTDALAQFAALAGVSRRGAETAVRRHLGLCFDVCHAAVGFENIAESLTRAGAAGVRIVKVQLSAALKLEDVTDEAENLLGAFDDGIYLHQTVEAREGALRRYIDLPQAFDALRRGDGGGEWRVHCHVPLFCSSYGALRSTQDVLSELLAICREREVAPHLEVETYTWNVLPADLRAGDVSSAIVRELQWVRSQLNA
jgi:sugar phosphate isomerase/epimerase